MLGSIRIVSRLIQATRLNHAIGLTVFMACASGAFTPAIGQTQGQMPAAPFPAAPGQTMRAQASDGVHLGVAACAGSNCHGATEPIAGSSVMQNEFTIWTTRDKHRRAYDVLLDDRAVRMARALGLPDAKSAPVCLDCHADNVPAEERGRQFQLADGVGCEACHGGASTWLGIHISGVSHRDNLAAGLYPTEQPVARAEKCLSCHFGDAGRFVNHRLYGAGHPRLTFELDTFTAIEPAHFVVDRDYVQRKGVITDLQVWSAGQAIALVRRMDALLDPRHNHQGTFPEPALFDCQSCHHVFDSLHAPRPTATGLGPGTVKLNDANAAMLRVAAQRIAPAAATALATHMQELHRATDTDWTLVQREAGAVRRAAVELVPALAGHQFTAQDMRAMADGVIAAALNGGADEYSHAEQTTMALESLVSGMRSAGFLDDGRAQALKTAMSGLYESFANDAVYRPDAFVKALHDFQRMMGR
ncbi:MAG: hypothetical protein JO038_05035 [Alphaproteobacteria bacterium]|nr:hypothetical protein [Alphaproteobacteria bacterium]